MTNDEQAKILPFYHCPHQWEEQAMIMRCWVSNDTNEKPPISAYEKRLYRCVLCGQAVWGNPERMTL